jgi:hypothetical protein
VCVCVNKKITREKKKRSHAPYHHQQQLLIDHLQQLGIFQHGINFCHIITPYLISFTD